MQPSSVEELDDMYQILDSAWKAQPLGECCSQLNR
jgi:hypothetical protein